MKRALLLVLTLPFVALGFVAGIVALCVRVVWAALVEGFLLAYGGEK